MEHRLHIRRRLSGVWAFLWRRLQSDSSHLIPLTALHLTSGFRPIFPSGLFLFGLGGGTPITVLDFPDGSCVSLTEVLSARKSLRKARTPEQPEERPSSGFPEEEARAKATGDKRRQPLIQM